MMWWKRQKRNLRFNVKWCQVRFLKTAAKEALRQAGIDPASISLITGGPSYSAVDPCSTITVEELKLADSFIRIALLASRTES